MRDREGHEATDALRRQHRRVLRGDAAPVVAHHECRPVPASPIDQPEQVARERRGLVGGALHRRGRVAPHERRHRAVSRPREIFEQRPERRSVVRKAVEAKDERTVPRLQVVQPDLAEVGDARGQRHWSRSASHLADSVTLEPVVDRGPVEVRQERVDVLGPRGGEVLDVRVLVDVERDERRRVSTREMCAGRRRCRRRCAASPSRTPPTPSPGRPFRPPSAPRAWRRGRRNRDRSSPRTRRWGRRPRDRGCRSTARGS